MISCRPSRPRLDSPVVFFLLRQECTLTSERIVVRLILIFVRLLHRRRHHANKLIIGVSEVFINEGFAVLRFGRSPSFVHGPRNEV
jgi:hypothetical protein